MLAHHYITKDILVDSHIANCWLLMWIKDLEVPNPSCYLYYQHNYC